jgi:kinetochore protein NDC80
MKGVHYPFPIKQSALFAWTPHTWPSLLGALHWLVELCTV